MHDTFVRGVCVCLCVCICPHDNLKAVADISFLLGSYLELKNLGLFRISRSQVKVKVILENQGHSVRL